MLNGVSRRTLLVLLIACNLAFWALAAIAVGLAASDVVDLGVESFARELQSTVVALSQARLSRPSSPATPAAIEPESPGTPQGRSGSQALAGTPVPGVQNPAPSVADIPADSAAATAAASEAASAAATASLVSQPLLLADPAFSNLMALNTELKRSAQGRVVQIRYTEAALNREVMAVLDNNSVLPAENVVIDLRRNIVVLSGDVTVIGFRVGAEVKGNVVVEACQPKLQVDAVSVAGALTPGFVKEAIFNMLQDSLEWYPPNYPLCLEQIVVEQDRLTVYGFRR